MYESHFPLLIKVFCLFLTVTRWKYRIVRKQCLNCESQQGIIGELLAKCVQKKTSLERFKWSGTLKALQQCSRLSTMYQYCCCYSFIESQINGRGSWLYMTECLQGESKKASLICHSYKSNAPHESVWMKRDLRSNRRLTQLELPVEILYQNMYCK